MFFKNHIRWYRLIGALLVFPNAIREWIDMLTDMGSYQGNIALINKIVGYRPTLVQTVFDRTIHNTWLAPIGAVGFIMMHLVAALLMTIGMVQMCWHLNDKVGIYRQKLTSAVFGLVVAIVSYLFFFGVLSMDYFMSQLQGLDYNGPIIATLLPCGIALFYLLNIE
jgi:predicted small integral membrane protein